MKTADLERAPLLLRLSTFTAFAAILLLFGMVLGFALPVLLEGGEGGPFTWTWNPGQGRFGIMPMLASSLLLSLSALILAFPLALGVACWLLGVGKGLPVSIVQNFIRFMTAIPTVVYGFVAVFLLTPVVRMAFGGTGLSWLSAALVLALLIMPTMIFVLQAGLSKRLEQLSPSGLALGFNKLDLLWLYALPAGRNTIVAALILGFGRAVGDTLLPLMLAGNATQVPGHIWESMRTLTAHMALVTANEVGGTAYNSLFTAGFLLLLINALVSMAVRRLGRKA